jgi:hypothetical protein
MRRISLVSALLSFPAIAHATTAGPVLELTASPATAAQRAPSISFDGTRYVMVWEDSRNAATGLDLYLARIGADGVIQDGMIGLPVLTPAVNGNQTEPQIAYSALAGTHLIVWTDPRNASSDVYAARFLSGSGSVIEQGGVQISDSNDPEGSAHAAFATQSWAVVWQSTLAGASEVRVRRVYPDLTYLDPGPFALTDGPAVFESKPRVLGLGTNFLVAWEDDRNSAVTGLDLFGRVMPDFGNVAGQPGLPISTSPFGQLYVDGVVLSPSTIAYVWEDDRLGPNVDSNIWRNLYNGSLAPLAAGEAAVTLAAANQQRPRVAGGSSGALVIWQDRRSGPIGSTFGARLDANGAVRDAGGFPLLAFNQNAIEHAVAKGPNNDYLVAAVRFDAGMSKVYYRIVRDEDPSGVMTLGGATSVPANGTTTANVTFGPARGASNTFDVVDGTLYTLELSRADVTVNVADADPARPGLQVPSIAGAVAFGLSSLEHGPVTLTLTSVEGNATGSGVVDFLNVPPAVTNAVVSPPNPRSIEDLTLVYTYEDVNGDAEAGTRIEWTKNLAVQGQFNNQLTVPASATFRGDAWRARITPRDGLNDGTFVFSNTVIIGNTPPSAADLEILPGTGVKTGTMLRGRYRFDDADSDAEADSEIRWFDRGNEVLALRDLFDVPASMVVKGQVWTFSVTPDDSMELGPTETSPPVTVENSIPVANAGVNLRVLERRSVSMTGLMSSDVDPQDTLTYQWTQVGGAPEVALSDSSSVTPSFNAPSISVTSIFSYELVVSDGEESSPADMVVIEVTPVPDPDGDGLDNEEEELYGTDPTLKDTDSDGFDDLEERNAGTNPRDSDTDDDGIRDGVEGTPCPDTEPCFAEDPLNDVDGDLLVAALDPDSDNDGIFDGTELRVISPPSGTSTASMSFIPDADRATYTNPVLADSDGDTVIDGNEDANHNGRVDDGESDPNNPADPERTCTEGGNECPPGTECNGGICSLPVIADGGLMCTALNPLTECCMGTCANGTAVSPVCASQGVMESCPVGAVQCQVGSCSEPDGPGGGDSGCGCTATRPVHSDTDLWISGLAFALVILTRARRTRR